MANPLPKEEELYERIRKEKIEVHPLVWDTMYHYLGDYVSAITVISYYYVEKGEVMPLEEARKILEYTRKIIEVVGKILHPERIEDGSGSLGKIKDENMTLHPVIKELFTHYISNDTNCINFRVGYYLDPIDEQPVPVNEVEKVLDYTASMGRFLDKLREATKKGKGY